MSEHRRPQLPRMKALLPEETTYGALMRITEGNGTTVIYETIAELRAEVERLQAFKNWVHKYLDDHGVPHHPPGPHGAEGCRIGDRMDYVFHVLLAARSS